jgi:hypothetical protein
MRQPSGLKRVQRQDHCKPAMGYALMLAMPDIMPITSPPASIAEMDEKAMIS